MRSLVQMYLKDRHLSYFNSGKGGMILPGFQFEYTCPCKGVFELLKAKVEYLWVHLAPFSNLKKIAIGMCLSG